MHQKMSSNRLKPGNLREFVTKIEQAKEALEVLFGLKGSFLTWPRRICANLHPNIRAFCITYSSKKHSILA